MVKYLKVNNEKLPVCIAYTALKKFQEQTGKSVMSQNGIMDDIFSGDLEYLLLFALESGYAKEGKECPYKKDDMAGLLDDCLFDFIKLIPEFFPKASNPGQTVQAEKK